MSHGVERARTKRFGFPIPGTLCAIAVTACPLQTAAAEERSQWATFFKPVDVSLVNVEVVVTDSDGNPIPGLTADDFEVFDDGRPVTVTNFYAAPGVAAPDAEDGDPGETGAADNPAEELFLALYLDEHNIEPRRRRSQPADGSDPRQGGGGSR